MKIKTLKYKLTALFLFCITITIPAQNEFSKWYFGNYAGLDFSTSPPTILTNGALSTAEGCATICDNNDGLLFYTNGTYVVNRQHLLMAYGSWYAKFAKVE